MTTSRTPAGLLQAALAAGAMAVLTGLVLWPSYHVGADTAHQSVAAIQASPVLRTVRNIHHWSSAGFILLAGLYVLSALATGAFHRPRRALWLGSLGFIGAGMLLQLTGHLLPWDQQAVSTASIETGIAEGAPVIGELQAKFIRGGNAVGPQTLQIWFLAHVAALSLVFLGLGIFLSLRMRRNQVPLQRGAILWTSLILALTGIVVAAPLGAAATAADYGSFAARPEWYILPLHSLLNIFQNIRPSLAFVGTMLIPGLAAVLLAALPWIDRRFKLGKPAAAILAVAVGILFIVSARDMAPPIGVQMVAAGTTNSAPVQLDPAVVAKGKQLFTDQMCDGCHKVNGKGGRVGPDLTDEAARHNDLHWQIMHLQSPSSMTPGSTMPKFGSLSTADQQALAEYVLSKK